jgi:hypothetical protein
LRRDAREQSGWALALQGGGEARSEQLPMFGACCGTAGTQADKVDYTRSVGWRVTLLLSIACLATSPAVHPILHGLQLLPFQEQLKIVAR